MNIRIFDLLIDRTHNRARYFADRAKYKKQSGDLVGYKEDIKKARELNPNIDKEESIIVQTLRPKKILFSSKI